MIEIRQSALQTFLDCRRKYYLQEVLGLVQQSEEMYPAKHSTAATGTIVHEPLAQYYSGELREDITKEELYDICMAKAVEIGRLDQPPSPGRESMVSDWYNAVEVATIMVDGYLKWVKQENMDLRFLVQMVEERLRWQVPGTRITITGQIDLVLYDELVKETGIIDHKTLDKLAIVRPGNFQILTYALLVWKNTGVVPEWGAHNQLKRNKQTSRAKPPFYDRKPITINERMLVQHEQMLTSLCQDIEQFADSVNEDNHHTTAYPNMTGECNWKCDVMELCDHMHDGPEVWVHIAESHYKERETHGS